MDPERLLDINQKVVLKNMIVFKVCGPFNMIVVKKTNIKTIIYIKLGESFQKILKENVMKKMSIRIYITVMEMLGFKPRKKRAL